MSSAAVTELLRACLDTGNAAAWGEFVRVYQRLIASMVLRALRQYTKLTPELVDDFVQVSTADEVAEVPPAIAWPDSFDRARISQA